MKFFKWIATWMHQLLATNNEVNEQTVMGLLSFTFAVVFGFASSFTAMGAFLGYSAACFALNWKYKE